MSMEKSTAPDGQLPSRAYLYKISTEDENEQGKVKTTEYFFPPD